MENFKESLVEHESEVSTAFGEKNVKDKIKTEPFLDQTLKVKFHYNKIQKFQKIFDITFAQNVSIGSFAHDIRSVA